jgi:hypothetical protein
MADTVETPSATDQRNDPIVQDSGNAPVPENADVTESLFGETVTDAELMGEEPGTDTPEEPTDSPEPSTFRSRAAPEDGSTKPDDEEPHSATPGDASEETETMGAVKPPPGYVPLAALHEERGKRQAMASKLQELEAAVAVLSEQKLAEGPQDVPVTGMGEGDEIPPDFKILTSHEYRDLAESDLVEAQIYLHNLNRFQKEQEQNQKAEQQRKAAEEQAKTLIQQRYSEMEQAVPGIFAEDGKINRSLTEFASNNGLDSIYLSAMTDPATRIVDQNGKTVLLGKGAVQMLTLLNNAYRAVKPNATKEDFLKAQGAAELLGKIKNTTAGYRDIGGTPPGGSSVPNDPNRVVTEAEMARMSPEEQERYLQGR